MNGIDGTGLRYWSSTSHCTLSRVKSQGLMIKWYTKSFQRARSTLAKRGKLSKDLLISMFFFLLEIPDEKHMRYYFQEAETEDHSSWCIVVMIPRKFQRWNSSFVQSLTKQRIHDNFKTSLICLSIMLKCIFLFRLFPWPLSDQPCIFLFQHSEAWNFYVVWSCMSLPAFKFFFPFFFLILYNQQKRESWKLERINTNEAFASKS